MMPRTVTSHGREEGKQRRRMWCATVEKRSEPALVLLMSDRCLIEISEQERASQSDRRHASVYFYFLQSRSQSLDLSVADESLPL